MNNLKIKTDFTENLTKNIKDFIYKNSSFQPKITYADNLVFVDIWDGGIGVSCVFCPQEIKFSPETNTRQYSNYKFDCFRIEESDDYFCDKRSYVAKIENILNFADEIERNIFSDYFFEISDGTIQM